MKTCLNCVFNHRVSVTCVWRASKNFFISSPESISNLAEAVQGQVRAYSYTRQGGVGTVALYTLTRISMIVQTMVGPRSLARVLRLLCRGYRSSEVGNISLFRIRFCDTMRIVEVLMEATDAFKSFGF